MDDELIARFVADDESAFAEVVETYQGRALAYAAALLGDADLAQDAVQEAFLEAHARRADLRDQAAFPAWLRAIVRTQAGRLRRQRAAAPLPDELEIPSGDAGPEAALAERQQRQSLAVAIADLPEHERIAVHLHYIAGVSQEEIARLVEVPAGTVKTRLHSARARLGERLLRLLRTAEAPLAARPSLAFVQRVRFFRALDRRDLATSELLLETAPALIHERRRRDDERVAGLRWGLTALHLAARAGDLEMAELLLRRGADLRAGNQGPDAPPGGTPLYLAAAYGHAAVVRALLARGASPEGTTPEISPLRAATIHASHPEVARLLLDAGATPTLFEAVALDDRPRVRAILEADPAAVNERLSGEARGDNPIAHTPLHIAARRDLAQMAVLLLEHGADAAARDAAGRTAIDQALARGHAATFGVLCARGGQPSPELVAQVGTVARAGAMEALIARTWRADAAGVQALLDEDPSLVRAVLPTFWPDNYVGATVVHLASCRGDIGLIDLLVARGADLEARDVRYGGRPEDWAEEFQQDAARRHLQALARRRPR
jgi:RNA polymerase sigma-70 factor (ECF subfamily)